MGTTSEAAPARTAALLVLDLINDFDHPDGHARLAATRERASALEAALTGARRAGWEVIYVNDDDGRWGADAPGLVRRAMAGPGGDLISRLAPHPGKRFVLKPSYTAFDGTPLGILLHRLRPDEVVLIGAVTEMCVRESAIDAARRGIRTAVLRAACVSLDPVLGDLTLEALERLTGGARHRCPVGAPPLRDSD